MSWLWDKAKDFGSSIVNATSLFGDNGILTNPTGSWDHFKNGETNDVNREIAEKNLEYQKEWNAEQMKFQRENFDYQKALQERIFAREDSSYQRTVNDMRAAGLSPLTMNGTNGAGEALQTSPIGEGLSAPQMNYQHTDMGNLNAISSVLGAVQNFRSANASIDNIVADTESKQFANDVAPLSFAVQLAGEILGNKSISADIRNKTADYGLKLLDSSAKALDNKFNEETFDFRKNLLSTQSSMASRANSRDKSAFDFDQFFGINDSMSDQEREVAMLSTLTGFPVIDKKGYTTAYKNALTTAKLGSNFLNVASDIGDVISKFLKFGGSDSKKKDVTFSRPPRVYNNYYYGR